MHDPDNCNTCLAKRTSIRIFDGPMVRLVPGEPTLVKASQVKRVASKLRKERRQLTNWPVDHEEGE